MFKLLNLFNKLFPKKKNRIVLYSNLGFRDNVKAIYDYLIDKNLQEKYEIVCVSNDFYSEKKITGVKYISPVVGVFFFLTSKYFFYCFGKYPIKPSKSQIVVNLWHGMPLKKIGNMEHQNQNKDYNFFSYIIASSDFFVDYMMKGFNASKEQVIVAGNPRNDDFFRIDSNLKNEKVVVWMPTFRDGGDVQNGSSTLIFKMSTDEWRQLDLFLSKINYKLDLKLHPLETTRIDTNFIVKLKNISLLDDSMLSSRNISLYQYLATTVALITDYSSVFLDYLLLNKPVAFVHDDYSAYKENRGFIDNNIENLFVGEKIFNFSDLVSFFDKLSNEFDDYKIHREKLNEVVNYYKIDFSKIILEKVGIL
ncbi:CDP-glycerol glycerophosphotransferase family protein [Enterococcus faecium]|nr:CDP-glycerol glycerophosphotransferase family protein [Enterococcus faecium]